MAILPFLAGPLIVLHLAGSHVHNRAVASPFCIPSTGYQDSPHAVPIPLAHADVPAMPVSLSSSGNTAIVATTGGTFAHVIQLTCSPEVNQNGLHLTGGIRVLLVAKAFSVVSDDAMQPAVDMIAKQVTAHEVSIARPSSPAR